MYLNPDGEVALQMGLVCGMASGYGFCFEIGTSHGNGFGVAAGSGDINYLGNDGNE